MAPIDELTNNLWEAAGDGDLTAIRQIIETEKKFTPLSPDHNGYTPLMASCSYGHTAMLKFLIDFLKKNRQHCIDLELRVLKRIAYLYKEGDDTAVEDLFDCDGERCELYERIFEEEKENVNVQSTSDDATSNSTDGSTDKKVRKTLEETGMLEKLESEFSSVIRLLEGLEECGEDVEKFVRLALEFADGEDDTAYHHFGCSCGDLSPKDREEVLNVLKTHKVNVDVKNGDGFTPFQMCILYDRESVPWFYKAHDKPVPTEEEMNEFQHENQQSDDEKDDDKDEEDDEDDDDEDNDGKSDSADKDREPVDEEGLKNLLERLTNGGSLEGLDIEGLRALGIEGLEGLDGLGGLESIEEGGDVDMEED